jgi:hypothetical protein
MKREFELLVEVIASLSLEDKHKLFHLLDEEIAQAEEELAENPAIQAEIQEARTEYQTGDYLTLDEYIAHQSQIAL